MYNWQLPNWPSFTYNLVRLQDIAVLFAKELGETEGLIVGLPADSKKETLLEFMISEAIKTSEIEGEFLSREDVMSSIKNNLGLHPPATIKDKRSSAIAHLMVEVRNDIKGRLYIEMIQKWHNILMLENPKVNAGKWRVGEAPMQIVSGSLGKEIVHYEAPPSNQIPHEMARFMEWWNQDEPESVGQISYALLKSTITHLYFESIHPFEDGNGRIGRALVEYTLSYLLGKPMLLSLSNTIEKDKKSYYAHLKQAQSSLEITEWITYFAEIILDAQQEAKKMVQFTLKKSQFFDKHAHKLNQRQLKVINRLLRNGTEEFEGGMTAKKYVAITKSSKATATRDLQQLYEWGIFVQEGAGRSVKYRISIE